MFSNPSAVPSETVNTTLTFADPSFSQVGTSYFKVRALDAAGNWGPPSEFVYVLTNVPPQAMATPKNNYFNPLRGEALKVNVQIREPGRVKVTLYTLQLREIAVLVDGELQAGSYDFDWFGRNAQGQVVATGIYLIHIEAPGLKKTFKTIVAK